ncbi:Hypothetical protein CINCED_3A013049 [Cinara cedri]|uniref:Uncharacterized protein n=1 Tax=Cinara cedri TaxID=506608 RepID=A0A5E4MMH9_9HEMI|nr:Hypothetical protein CINCED_3A013049 [Cinara cedri]
MSQPPPTTPPPSTSPPPLQSVVVDERPSINNSGPLNIIASTSEKMAEKTQDYQTVSEPGSSMHTESNRPSNLNSFLEEIQKVFVDAVKKNAKKNNKKVDERENPILFSDVDLTPRNIETEHENPLHIYTEMDSTLPSNVKRQNEQMSGGFPNVDDLRKPEFEGLKIIRRISKKTEPENKD